MSSQKSVDANEPLPFDVSSLLVRLGLTVTDVAARTPLSRATVTRMKLGQGHVSRTSYSKLVNALDRLGYDVTPELTALGIVPAEAITGASNSVTEIRPGTRIPSVFERIELACSIADQLHDLLTGIAKDAYKQPDSIRYNDVSELAFSVDRLPNLTRQLTEKLR